MRLITKFLLTRRWRGWSNGKITLVMAHVRRAHIPFRVHTSFGLHDTRRLGCALRHYTLIKRVPRHGRFNFVINYEIFFPWRVEGFFYRPWPRSNQFLLLLFFFKIFFSSLSIFLFSLFAKSWTVFHYTVAVAQRPTIIKTL